MGHYNNATVCMNGHAISRYNANAQPHCEECGAKTISYCLKCNAPIHGEYSADGVCKIGFKYTPPNYCWKCGEPYPWTEKIISNAWEILNLDEDLDDKEKQLIRQAIPNLMIETPDTPVAIVKYKKGIGRATESIKNAMRQLLIDVVVEVAKQKLF